jgi:hypothetical protein
MQYPAYGSVDEGYDSMHEDEEDTLVDGEEEEEKCAHCPLCPCNPPFDEGEVGFENSGGGLGGGGGNRGAWFDGLH